MRQTFIGALLSTFALGDWAYFDKPDEGGEADHDGFDQDTAIDAYDLNDYNDNTGIFFELSYYDTINTGTSILGSVMTSDWSLQWNNNGVIQNELKKEDYYEISNEAQKNEYEGKTTTSAKRNYWRDDVQLTSKFSIGICWIKDWEDQFAVDT